MVYVKIGNAAKELGISQQTVRKWVDEGKIPHKKTPGGHRFVDIETYKGTPKEERTSIFYCRVSSKKQENDLSRQIELATEYYPKHEIVSDISSGINYNRKGLKSILERVTNREIKEVVIFHRDRLCRFGFELIEFILSLNNTKLIVHDNTEQHRSTEQELAEDIISVINIFSCKQMGKRRYSKKDL